MGRATNNVYLFFAIIMVHGLNSRVDFYKQYGNAYSYIQQYQKMEGNTFKFVPFQINNAPFRPQSLTTRYIYQNRLNVGRL